MRIVILVTCLLFSSIANADTYDLLPTSVERDIVENITNTEVGDDEAHMIILDNLDNIEVVIDDSVSKLQFWHDIYLYLSQGLTLGIGGFLSRIGYLYYQTKSGKLIVKHIKNKASDLEDDIIDNISRITDLETGEELRSRLKDLEDKLLQVAKKKLPPKPDTET